MPSTNNVSKCIAWCNNNKFKCTGINVIPFKNPPNVVSFLSDEYNIKYNKKQCRQGALANDANADSFICYGFFPPTDEPEVGTIYTVSDDPTDPVFYSTCYTKEEVTRIAGTSPTNTSKDVIVPWHFDDKCISCAQATSNAKLPNSKVAKWDIINNCKKCD